MQRTDKFLIGIVAGMVVLVAVGFTVMLLRPRPGYQPEDTPGGVANNYLLAIQDEDYERAYGYISPELPGYPLEISTFSHYVGTGGGYGYGGGTSIEVKNVQHAGDRATVSFEQTTFYENGLFGSNSYASTYQMTLVRLEGQWRIEHSDAYWAWCLDTADSC